MDRGAVGVGSAWRGVCGRDGIGQVRAAVARRADRPKQSARYLRCAPPAGARGKPGQDGRSTLGPLWAGALFKEGRCMADKTVALKIGDSEKSYPVLSGSVGPDVIDIRKLYGETGAFTYDPGFTSTASCESKITYIDGDEGVLLHRGYPIGQLAEQSSFMEVAYLLLRGRSEEHTSELQSLMRISYAVFCLKKKKLT